MSYELIFVSFKFNKNFRMNILFQVNKFKTQRLYIYEKNIQYISIHFHYIM